MNRASGGSRCGSERLLECALEILPPAEARDVEAHLTGCAACRADVEALQPVISALVHWPTDVLRPSTSLWEQLASRVAAQTGTEPVPPADDRWHEPEWEAVAPGIECKLLATDPETDRVSMLVRLAPGAAYPPHTHAGVEELHLLHGELVIDHRTLRPGDYNLGEPGGSDKLVWSETGCTCVLVTSARDVLG